MMLPYIILKNVVFVMLSILTDIKNLMLEITILVISILLP